MEKLYVSTSYLNVYVLSRIKYLLSIQRVFPVSGHNQHYDGEKRKYGITSNHLLWEFNSKLLFYCLRIANSSNLIGVRLKEGFISASEYRALCRYIYLLYLYKYENVCVSVCVCVFAFFSAIWNPIGTKLPYRPGMVLKQKKIWIEGLIN